MSATGKEYELAIRISGIVDKSFNTALVGATTGLKGFKTTISAMDKDFTKLDKGFDSIVGAGKKCFSALATAAGVATVAIGAVTAASIAVGTEFESAFAGVKKTVDATDAEYAKLREDILDMSEVIPSSASEIAGVMEIAGQLGIATDSLTDFTETMINLGVSTNLAAEDAATALARFANVTNMANYGEDGISNYERLGSTIVDLGNNFATTEEEIVNMATNLAATGDMVGLSQADIMGLSTAMSAVGIKAEKGGTAMSKLLKKMQLAVETNGETLSDYASVADMSVSEFSDLFQNDAMSATAAFIEGLNDTERNGKSAVAVLNDMGLSEVRLSDVILRLANAQGELTQEQIDSAIAADVFEENTLDATYSSSLLSDALKTANEAWEENTALAIEAGKRYETTESQLEILRNNIQELGITAYDDLREPFVDTLSVINDKVQNLNDYLGSSNGVSKWVQNISTTLPTMQRKVKAAWKDISPFFNGLLSVGKWFLKNPQVIVSGIAGIGTALVTYKIASSIVHIANALMSFASMNPVTLGIMGVVVALGALATAVTAYKQYEQKLVDSNIADHFGSLSLSMQEIQEVADYIVSSQSLQGVKDALDEFSELDSINDTMQEAIDSLNKANWKVSIGMELTEDEQESYKEEIQNYVSSAQEYALQAQYAVSIDLNLMLEDGSLEDSNLVSKVNQFYQDKYDELSSLGTELSDAVTDAFNDGFLDIDEIGTITKLQNQMAEIQRQLAVGDYEAELSSIAIDYSGTELDSDSFLNLQQSLQEAADSATEAYKEEYKKRYASITAAHEGGYLTDSEYQSMIDSAMQDRENGIAEINMRSLEFLINTINENYSDEIAQYQEAVDSALAEYGSSDYAYDWEERPVIMWDGLMQEIFQNGPSDTTKKAIADLLENMDGYITEIEDLKENWDSLSPEMQSTVDELSEQLNTLRGMTVYQKFYGQGGDMQGLYADVAGQVSDSSDYSDSLKAWVDQYYEDLTGYANTEASTAAANLVADNINAAAEESVRPAVEGMYAWSQETIDEYYSQGFTASADVDITLNPKLNGLSGLAGITQYTTPSLITPNQRADGGLATSPELTWFAENGPEMAIPIDGSRNAISLWEQTGRLLGMDSVLDSMELDGGDSSTSIEYKPTLQFYGEAPTKEDLTDALKVSQDEFESLMEKYLKTHGRVSLA